MPRHESSGDAPGAVAIDVQGVTRDFPDTFGAAGVRALDDVSLRIARGEVVGLLGPNGSGKTTLLKILLGLVPPTAGSCALFGFSSCDARVRARIGFLGEASAFPRFLTGRELIEHAARLHGLTPAAARERAGQLLAWAGLADAADRRLAQYSHGMRQRAGLAQAIAHDPALLILDEPTTGLDPLGVAEFGALVRDLAARGKTILLSSHHLAQVEAVCSRVVILNRGRVIADRALARTGSPMAPGDLEAFFLATVKPPAASGGNVPDGDAPPPSRSGLGPRAASERDEGVASPPEPETENPKRKPARTGFGATLTRMRLVAGLTVRETIRQRTPYLALFLAAAFVLGAQLLRGFDFGRSELKFLTELGLGAAGLFTAVLAVAVAAQSFAGELERGGATWQLATPLRRGEFVLGKFLGAWTALTLFLAVLLGLLAAQVAARAFELGVPIGPALAPLAGAALAQTLKLGVVLALTLLLASWMRAPLFVLGSGGLLVAACHLQGFAHHAWSHSTSALARGIAAVGAILLPDLATFERGIGDASVESLSWLLAYGAVYMAGLLALTCLLFRRREL